jgi:hypothetical protein
MLQIDVTNIFPGEFAVREIRVAAHRATLARGEPLDPITVADLDGRYIVRDANNRVRAAIDHYAALGEPCPLFDAELSTRPYREIAAADYSYVLRRFADHYGRGPSGFSALPVLSDDDYYGDRGTKIQQSIGMYDFSAYFPPKV